MSEPIWRVPLVSQYLAALDMIENAIRACPDHVWADPATPVAQQFSYLAFHVLWWNDYYLTKVERDYVPPPPFTRDELDPAGVYPAVPYTPDQLLAFVELNRARSRARFGDLSEEQAARPCGFEHRNMSLLELALYNLRHLQHHTAQLNLILRQRTDDAPRWVSRGRGV